MKNNWVIPLAAMFVILADALSKQWALANLSTGSTEAFIPGILQFTLTTNTGGAFGIAKHTGGLMTILPITICVAIVVWIVKRTRSGFSFSLYEQTGYGLVLGGAIGNIIERLARGHVTDFLDFAFVTFPIFNVADSFIDIGVAIVVLHTIFARTPEEQQSLEARSAETPDEPKNG